MYNVLELIIELIHPRAKASWHSQLFLVDILNELCNKKFMVELKRNYAHYSVVKTKTKELMYTNIDINNCINYAKERNEQENNEQENNERKMNEPIATAQEKKTKIIRVNMKDGSQWDIPADIVASNQASHVCSNPENVDAETYWKKYEQQFDFVLANNRMLMDWAENGMTWDVIKQFAICSKKAEPNNDENWRLGTKTILEV